MREQSISTVWPEWSVVEQIGSGSYGTVYKAVRREHGIESFSAIKVISIPQTYSEVNALMAEGLSLSKTRTYYEGVVNDFVNEIRVMESLKGVQNIVGVEDYKVVEREELGWDIYIRMELLTPFEQYAKDKEFTEEMVIRVGCDICTALEICGKQNIIHRDIKPENIFVSDFDFFKLGDFGVARKLENLSGSMSQKGTYNYMAPEVASGPYYDARADIYSLGIVLYRLMNHNHLPFLDTEAQIMAPMERKRALDRRLRGEPLPPPANASSGMAHVILKACSFDPQQRYETPQAFREALLSLKKNDPHVFSVWDETVAVRRNPNENDQTVSVRRVPDYPQQNIDPDPGRPSERVWSGAYSAPEAPPEKRNVPSFDRKPRSQTSVTKIVLVTVLTMLSVAVIIGGTIILTIKMQENKEEEQQGISSAEVVQPEETTEPQREEETTLVEPEEPEGKKPEPKVILPKEDIQATENAVEDAVENYLYAYIQDMNNGTYNALYSAVEYGSNLEETQKKFIQNSSLYETLLEYSVISTKRVDKNTYHVTTIEDYDVLNYDSGNQYYQQQKCIYEVCKQADGTWLIRDYVEGVEQLEKIVY